MRSQAQSHTQKRATIHQQSNIPTTQREQTHKVAPQTRIRSLLAPDLLSALPPAGTRSVSSAPASTCAWRTPSSPPAPAACSPGFAPLISAFDSCNRSGHRRTSLNIKFPRQPRCADARRRRYRTWCLEIKYTTAGVWHVVFVREAKTPGSATATWAGSNCGQVGVRL